MIHNSIAFHLHHRSYSATQLGPWIPGPRVLGSSVRVLGQVCIVWFFLELCTNSYYEQDTRNITWKCNAPCVAVTGTLPQQCYVCTIEHCHQ